MAFSTMALAILALMTTTVVANQADTIMPAYIPATGCTCKVWANAGVNFTSIWASTTKLQAANSSCAMPANAARSLNYKPWCVCSENDKETACSYPMGVPEQINLQLASTDVVVAGFVTFEESAPTTLPQATLTEISTGTVQQLTGVSHWYVTSHVKGTPRQYAMHFVRFNNLKPQASYSYKVKSGASNGTWSDEFTFRAPYGYGSGVTKIAIYGDMGNSQYNNQENLGADCASGKVDAILHMGDHAYDMGDTDDYRGDSYMNAFSQAALATCPWMPVIGNHESTQCPGDLVDESTHERYLNQTWGPAYGEGLNSSATSALGHLLTRGSLLGAGVHGSKPSGTSQWYSVDLGLIHLVGLDLDPGTPPHGPIFAGVQQSWLEQDLAAANANRANVPWIIVTSHFPIYNAKFEGNLDASASWYLGLEAETFATSGHDFVPCSEPGCRTVRDILQTSASNLVPLLEKYAVDIYDAGHVHSYDTTWPMCNGTICGGVKSYSNPKGTIHITEGNGGVPGVAGVNSVKNCSTAYGRICGTGGAYGRFTAFNSTVLQYEHVENPTGKVSDEWLVTKAKAGRGW